MATGVYQIRNTINGHSYIGSTARSFCERWSAHLSNLRRNTKKHPHLQNAWNKYGKDVFIFDILEECLPEDCIRREQYYMDTLKPEYNTNPIAKSSLGVKHSDETRRKNSEAQKRRPPMTEESRRKLSKSLMGRVVTQETRDKIRKANTGKTHSEESKKRMSEAHSGERHSNYGKHLSKETREKIRQALTGVAHTEARKQAQSRAAKKAWTPKRRQAQSKKMTGKAVREIPHRITSDGTELKWCNYGKHWVSIEQFGKNKNKTGGLQYCCNDCRKQYQREWRKRKKKEVKN